MPLAVKKVHKVQIAFSNFPTMREQSFPWSQTKHAFTCLLANIANRITREPGKTEIYYINIYCYNLLFIVFYQPFASSGYTALPIHGIKLNPIFQQSPEIHCKLSLFEQFTYCSIPFIES